MVVEARGRFVQQQDLRLHLQGSQDAHPASLPAGEPRQPGVGLLAEPDGVEHLFDAAHPARRRQLDRADPLQLVPHPPLGVVGPALLHQPDPRPEVGARPARIGAEHTDPAARRRQRTQQVLHEGRLAHAVGAEQADHLADLDRRTALADAPAPAPAPDKRTAGEYIKAIASGDERAIETINTIMTRAYQGGVLGDDALASTPTFMRDLTQIITDANPLSRHFATGALPMQGMTMEYTELKENTVTVGKQVNEGDDLATGKVSTKVKTADIETFGGGASLSFQEIQRARANMVDLTVRAMTAAAAKDAATNFHTAWEKQVKDATNAITISKALASLNYADIVAMLLDVNAAYQELGSSISGLIVDRATFLKLATLENSSGTPYMAVSGHGTGTIGTLTSDVLAGTLGNVAVIPDLKATSNRGEKVAGAFFNADAIRVHSSGLAHLQDDKILNLTRDLSVYYYSAIAPERPDLILPLKIGA